MSMNVFISANRKITFKKKNGKRGGGIQTVKFEAIQTPTNITYEIIRSNNPKQAYIDWVMTKRRIERLPIYADDDIFGERDPVKFKEYDFAKEHVERLLKWIEEVEEEGYTVRFEVI